MALAEYHLVDLLHDGGGLVLERGHVGLGLSLSRRLILVDRQTELKRRKKKEQHKQKQQRIESTDSEKRIQSDRRQQPAIFVCESKCAEASRVFGKQRQWGNVLHKRQHTKKREKN